MPRSGPARRPSWRPRWGPGPGSLERLHTQLAAMQRQWQAEAGVAQPAPRSRRRWVIAAVVAGVLVLASIGLLVGYPVLVRNAFQRFAVGTWDCGQVQDGGSDILFTVTVTNSRFTVQAAQPDGSGDDSALTGSWRLADGRLVLVADVRDESSGPAVVTGVPGQPDDGGYDLVGGDDASPAGVHSTISDGGRTVTFSSGDGADVACHKR